MIFTPKVLESHIAIVGKTGSGKTITAKGIVEHLLRNRERVCIIDPVSAWWGLRSDTDGLHGGFPVVIFGGPRGDIPIGGSHGSAVAEIVANSDTPTIIDLKLMSVKDRTQFFIDFAVTIMQKNEGVLHMVIDEAHLFAPKGKVNSPKAGEMLSETNNLVTGGRGVGFRFLMITQRPAKLHNDCLASIETLVAQRLTLGADRDAVKTWIDDCASAAQGREVLASLPMLETGEGWVWSPGENLLKRTTFPMITTFDSSNPKNLRRSNVKLSSINIPEIRVKLEKAAGDVVNDDPVQLKRLLRERDNTIRDLLAIGVPCAVEAPAPEPEIQYVDKPVLTEENLKWLEGILTEFTGGVGRIETELRRICTEAVAAKLSPQTTPDIVHRPITDPSVPRRLMDCYDPDLGFARQDSNNGNGLDRMRRSMLIALAQHPEGLKKSQILLHTDYRSSGSTSKAFTELIKFGYAEGDMYKMEITAAGKKALGVFTPLPTGRKLREFVLSGNKLSTMEKAILSVVCKQEGRPIGKGQILEAANYKSSGSTSKAFTRLVAYGYAVSAGSSQLRMADELR